MKCSMEFKVGSWLYHLIHADRLSGLERVGLETHKCLIELMNNNGSFMGVCPKDFSGTSDFPKFPEIAKDNLITSYIKTAQDVDCLWLNSLNPHGYLEIVEARKLKTKVVAMVYDLFPIIYPNYFPEVFVYRFKIWLMLTLKASDYLVFTSKEQLSYFNSLNLNYLGGKTVIGLGASISGPIFPSRVRDPFGMVAVSTIEPRKCYEDILDTFDILRAFGYPITLDIVGRHGWGQEAIANRIRSHEEFGKSLVWHSNCDDKELTEIYRRTSISIVASKNEGWGLSIEEGIRHGHKVIARDIEIFRSRNNPNIYFFDNNSQPMADTIIHAVEKEFIGMHNQRTMMDFSTELLNLMISMR
jgi:glycosyltransferase involved in cell wall biosynthesis